MVYRPEIDVASLEAVDIHVHIEQGHDGHPSLPPALHEAAQKYFKSDGVTPDVDGVAAYFRERRIAAVVFTVDSRTQLDHVRRAGWSHSGERPSSLSYWRFAVLPAIASARDAPSAPNQTVVVVVALTP